MTIRRLCNEGLLEHFHIPSSTHKRIIKTSALKLAQEYNIPLGDPDWTISLDE